MKISDNWASCFWRELNQYLMTSASRKQHQQVYPSSLGLLQPKREWLGLSGSLGISQPHKPFHLPLQWLLLASWAADYISARWEAILLPTLPSDICFMSEDLSFSHFTIPRIDLWISTSNSFLRKKNSFCVFRLLPRRGPTLLFTGLQCLNINFSINFLPILSPFFILKPAISYPKRFPALLHLSGIFR